MNPTPSVSSSRRTVDLAPFLEARSIAVVGASDDRMKVGGRVMSYLLRYGYEGAIYPVNPKRSEVLGITAYASLAEIPEAADLAVLALPVAAVQDAVAECGRRGIPAAIVFASGYSESGDDGAILQEELGHVARESGVRVLGPNCVGVVGASHKVAASMMSGLEQNRFDLRDDGIAFVSQSGAVGAFLLNMAQGHGVGLGRFVSTGNEVDITLGEVAEAFAADDSTRALLGYIEGVRDADGFRHALSVAERRGIPTCFMKVGRTSRGAEAAASHTGSLAGEDKVYDGIFAQYGVTRADTFEELLDFGRIMTLPRARGHRATIVTISGGAGILAVDAAERFGVEVPQWEGQWRERMSALLPSFAATGNPIDATGGLAADEAALRGVLDLCNEHPETDVTMIILGNLERIEDHVVEVLGEVVRNHSTPLVVVWVGGSGKPLTLLGGYGIAAFEEPVRALRAVGWWMDFAARQRALAATPSGASTRGGDFAEVTAFLDGAIAEGRVALDEAEGKQMLASAGLPVVQEIAAETPAQAWEAAGKVGLPVVVKLLSDEVQHKSELGVVRLGLSTQAEVEGAVSDIRRIADENGIADRRVTVQPYVSSDTELIVGMKHDPVFGPVVLLGIGGVLTEVVADVALRLVPFGLAEAHRMINELEYVALLEGPRGRVAVDKDRLAQLLVTFADLTQAVASRVESMEINPFMVMNDGSLLAVDALVILREATGG